MSPRASRPRRAAAAALALLAATATACSGPAPAHVAAGYHRVATRPTFDPRAALLAASVDHGPSHARDVDALVDLAGSARPATLLAWATTHRLRVDWRAGQAYAVVHGAAPDMSRGFAVSVHDYTSRSGQRFYATATDAGAPAALRGAVTGVGRISSYLPTQETAGIGGGLRDDVPNGGLTPKQLLRVYGASSLAQQGFTGKGATVVFFELDGFRQSDMDAYASQTGLPRFTPALDSDQPGMPGGETPMDLEVVHAIAPDAKLVVFDARYQAHSLAQLGPEIAQQYQTVDRKYPGAIWSISLGISCETLLSAADLQPAASALDQAESHGTSVFISSGDSGGLECKGRSNDYGSPPTQADVGLNLLSAFPQVTAVGGTALSTDNNGGWVAEQAWTETATQQGTSGGPSMLFARPSWQQASGIAALPDNTHRMTPDVSADADPVTGAKIIVDGQAQQGGGTSQAAPIWAGLTVLMNEYLAKNGGDPLGNINPLLYKAAAATPAAFHDVSLGGNSVDTASVGFDYTTGLGSPNVQQLVPALLTAEKGS